MVGGVHVTIFVIYGVKEVKKQNSFIIIFGTEVVLDFLFFLDFAAHS